MAKNYPQMAKDILQYVGGEENVSSLSHCMTRLRFKLKEESKAELTELKKVSGVIQVMISAGQYQVVIGTDVGDVYDEIGKLTSIRLSGEEADDTDIQEKADTNKKNFVNAAIDMISSIFLPFISAFMGAGLLKGFLTVLTITGLMSTESGTYTLLYAIADGVFTFLPIFLASTAGKKFGSKPFVSMAVAAAMVYPNITALHQAGEAVNFLGIPITLINYTSSVIPIIVAVFFQSKLEKAVGPRIPKVVRGIFLPVISLVVTSLLTFMIIGPVTNFLAGSLANGVVFLLELCPPLAGAVLGAIYPIMIIFGLHWGLVPIAMNNFMVLGYDPIMSITIATNFAIVGCVFGVFLKTKNTELKQMAGTCCISAFLAGITEPSIYGILLKYKRPFVIVCILDAISGVAVACLGGYMTGFVPTCALTLPALIAMMGKSALIASIIGIVGGAAATLAVGYNDNMIEK